MIRRISAGLEGVVAATAIPAGLLMIADPTGDLLGLDEGWLDGSPFPDYLFPGLFLVVVNGLGMLIAAAAEITRHPLAPVLTLLAGLSLSVFEAIQVTVIPLSPLQIVFLGVGMTLAGVALWRLTGRDGTPG